MFSVLDLAEERRPSRIIVCVLALANHVAKHVKDYAGPVIKDSVSLSAKTMYSQAFIDGEDVLDVTSFLCPSNIFQASLTPEQQHLVDWANSQFESRGSNIRISGLLSDLRSGLKLLELIQVLFFWSLWLIYLAAIFDTLWKLCSLPESLFSRRVHNECDSGFPSPVHVQFQPRVVLHPHGYCSG